MNNKKHNNMIAINFILNFHFFFSGVVLHIRRTAEIQTSVSNFGY